MQHTITSIASAKAVAIEHRALQEEALQQEPGRAARPPVRRRCLYYDITISILSTHTTIIIRYTAIIVLIYTYTIILPVRTTPLRPLSDVYGCRLDTIICLPQEKHV